MAWQDENQVAQRIADHARDMDYSVLRDSSKLSGSKYVNLTHDKLPDQQLKVRVSSHDLPPSYGPPGDLDVATNERPSGGGIHWSDAIANLASRVGADVPPIAAREITRRRNAELPKAAPAHSLAEIARALPTEWAKLATLKTDAQKRKHVATMRTMMPGQEAAQPGGM
jgi:hypothetical protein